MVAFFQNVVMWQNVLMWCSLAAAVVLSAAGAFVWCDAHAVLPGRRILRAFVRLPWLVRLFLAAFVVQLVVHGSTKANLTNGVEGGSTSQTTGVSGGTTNPPPAMAGLLLGSPRASYGVDEVTDEDIARGYRLERVSTNSECSFAFPANGVLCGHWHQRGAYDDVTCVDFGDWTFPLGTTAVSRLWAFVNGSVRPAIRDTIHEIAPVGTPLSAIPSVSRLWTATTTNDARLVTWENFAIGRLRRADYPLSSTDYPLPSTDYPLLSAQIELNPDGDFVTRSNEVEIAYRRVDPNDWDGDGWHNDDDPSPKVWTDGTFGLEQSLPTNANADAYCWVDVWASYNTSVRFVGDGPSNLPDPVFTARAGTTYRVMLLIGKGYEVTSDRPLSVVSRSSGEIEVDGDGTTAVSIRYPVDIHALEGNGNGFMMRITPSNLGGAFTWTQSCCPITGAGNRFWYAHTGNCACGGCYAEGVYVYEGYSLACEGGHCGCPWYDEDDPYETQVDDGPYAASASVVFSSPAVIFEDAYTNRPGEVVARRSTRTTLACTAHGGESGVTATFSIAGEGRLVRTDGGTLPVTKFVPPQQKLEFAVEYEGCLPSESVGDIVATASASGEGVSPTNATAELTSVRVELRAVYEAPENKNPTRHLYGVGEQVQFEAWPKLSDMVFHAVKFDSDDSTTSYDTFGGLASVDASANRLYKCPATGIAPDITISLHDARYRPAMTVIEPQSVVTPEASGSGSFLPGEVGMGCLTTRNFIGPMTVSFKGVHVFEIPCTNAIPPTGYFATNYMGHLVHDYDAGAGNLHSIGTNNYWMTDAAGRDIAYPNWSQGRLTWKIPIGWRRISDEGPRQTLAVKPDYERFGDESSRPLLIGNSEDAYLQIYTIDSDGTAAVEKFGYRLSRSRWSIWGTVIKVE